MATDAQVQELRLLVAESVDELPWTDAKLGAVIDGASGDLNLAAYKVWQSKAAGFAELVNISEGGSTRANGDLHQNALRMASHFGAKVSTGVEIETRATRVHRLSR